MYDVIIIGGGASGIACALTAAKKHPDYQILLLEKQSVVGKKLLVTGNGRCNLGNKDINESCYRSSNPELLAEALKKMSANTTLSFMHELGILCFTEADSGRIYPLTNQASTIVESLLLALRRADNITVQENSEVADITLINKGFCLHCCNGTEYYGAHLVLSGGGQAALHKDEKCNSYSLAKNLGHTCTRLYPSLVALRTSSSLDSVKGIRAKCKVSLVHNGTAVASEFGEVQFADYGLSGVVVMDISNYLRSINIRHCSLILDMLPEISPDNLTSCIFSRIRSYPDEPIEDLLTGLVTKRLGFAVLKSAGISPLSRRNATLSTDDISTLSKTIKAWEHKLTGTMDFEKAQVTGGGIPLSEIDINTMQSLKCPGLFLTGELLDVTGNCGGYNLHWAWCSGISAGNAI